MVVDDGIATGSTARAACQVARAQGAARVVLAVPVCPPETARALREEVDELVCLEAPRPSPPSGSSTSTSARPRTRRSRRLLDAARHVAAPVGGVDDAPLRCRRSDGVVDEEVAVPAGRVRLAGHLTVPAGARGLVVFAHGSGSSRHSPRNRYVAGVLQRAGLATLLFDLLTRDEELDRANVFDIELLADRLARSPRLGARPSRLPGSAGRLLRGQHRRGGRAVGGRRRPGRRRGRLPGRPARPGRAAAGTGAGADAADRRRPGRRWCSSSTGRHRPGCGVQTRLAVVPGATHLFEEPGTLEQAATLARDWFVDHLAPPAHRPGLYRAVIDGLSGVLSRRLALYAAAVFSLRVHTH